MTTRVRIRMGPIEVEYEGSEDFLRNELAGLISAVSNLYNQSSIPSRSHDQATIPPPAGRVDQPQITALTGTTGTIAAKLGCKSGPDLAIAAAAHLTFVEQQDSFTRQQIIDDMKTATSYFKKSYVNNLTNYLTRLVRDQRLTEVADGIYTLPAEMRKELEQQLVE